MGFVGLGIEPRFKDAPEEAIRQGKFFAIVRAAGEPRRFEFTRSDKDDTLRVIVDVEVDELAPRLVLKQKRHRCSGDRRRRRSCIARASPASIVRRSTFAITSSSIHPSLGSSRMQYASTRTPLSPLLRSCSFATRSTQSILRSFRSKKTTPRPRVSRARSSFPMTSRRPPRTMSIVGSRLRAESLSISPNYRGIYLEAGFTGAHAVLARAPCWREKPLRVVQARRRQRRPRHDSLAPVLRDVREPWRDTAFGDRCALHRR